MEKPKLKKWGVVEHLKTPEDMQLYFDSCMKEGDSSLITAALGDIAHVRGMKLEHMGIMSREEYKKRTIAIAKGEHMPEPDEPKIWFESEQALAQALINGNPELFKQSPSHPDKNSHAPPAQ